MIKSERRSQALFLATVCMVLIVLVVVRRWGCARTPGPSRSGISPSRMLPALARPSGVAQGGVETPSAEHTVSPSVPTRDVDMGGLLPEEYQAMTDMLSDALATPVSSLIQGVIDAHRRGEGKEMYRRVMLLVWSLAHKPEGLAEVDRRVTGMMGDKEDIHNLILITGTVGSDESRRLLLRWLDSAALSEFEGLILESLNQYCLATLRYDEEEYKAELHRDSAGCFLSLYPHGHSSADPDTVRAVALRTQASRARALRRTAEGILLGLAMPPERFQQVAPETRDVVTQTFRSLRESNDPALRNDALDFLAKTGDALAIADSWTEYSRQTDEPARASLAFAIATRVSSIEELRRVLVAARDLQSPVRGAFVTGLNTMYAKEGADRSAAAREIASYAAGEQDEGLRLQALERLSTLLPESAQAMQWALSDPSEAVRTRATQALQKK